MKFTILKILSIGVFTALFSGCATTTFTSNTALNKITNKECSKPTKNLSAWHIDNLYDCKTKSFFIPYQLWSGAKFDGNKETSINHQVDNTSYAIHNKSSKLVPIKILGTKKWINKITNEENNIYVRTTETKGVKKVQYFVANEMGIGRVYDDREGGRYFSGTGMKFPSGYGWKLGERRTAFDIENGEDRTTEIEIVAMTFDDKQELKDITFNWWTNGYFDRQYTYTVNNGLAKSVKQ